MGDDLTRAIIGCVIRVHQTLGPGFFESVYRRALHIELLRRDIPVEAEASVHVYYEGHEVGRHRIDLLVDRRTIVEVKTVEALNGAHYAQVRSYLAATGLTDALLVNFAGERADFRRVDRAPRVTETPEMGDEGNPS